MFSYIFKNLSSVAALYTSFISFKSCNMALTFNSPPSMSSLSPNLSWVGPFFAPSCGGEPISPTEVSDQKIMQEIDQCHGINSMTTNESCFHKDVVSEKEEESGFLTSKKMGGIKLLKRPARLVVPEYLPGDQEFCEKKNGKLENKEFEVEGRDFFLAAKKGKREVMEDGYGVLLDIMGDSKQAFFAVIDGHGGRAATDYVAENLGRNIVKEVERHVRKKEDYHQLEEAIRAGYLVTDKGFLSQGVSGGACAASVLLRDGYMHVANVGDCKIVVSKKGIAHALTKQHRLTWQEERLRIENSGGLVHCCSGVWRVQGTLAVSRAIGDQHLKEWVISDPEIKTFPLTSDCQFLILASDGLWDKVDDQEAVDVVLREDLSVLNACKRLVDMSSKRGNIDDITVMIIKLQNFVTTNG